MPLVVPVKFTYASRDLWFDPQDLDILEADYAICSTERGTEIGLVTADPFEVPQDEIGQPSSPCCAWRATSTCSLPTTWLSRVTRPWSISAAWSRSSTSR